MSYQYIVRASYGNDSVALVQFIHELGLKNVTVLYSDTGWAAEWWKARVDKCENWVRSIGFTPARTESIGMVELVRERKSWPRQGMQFCTQELKLLPGLRWMEKHDPECKSIVVIGKRREESENRKHEPEWIEADDPKANGRRIWQPLVYHLEADRNKLLTRAGFDVLPHRSMECYPCINANREDLKMVTEERVAEIEFYEKALGFTGNGKPRTMFRPYRYMGATGIREIIKWANCERGKYVPPDGDAGFTELDDGNGIPGCDSGLCGG